MNLHEIFRQWWVSKQSDPRISVEELAEDAFNEGYRVGAEALEDF